MLVEHRIHDVHECLVTREKSVSPSEEIAFEPTLAEVLAQHLHHTCVRREVLIRVPLADDHSSGKAASIAGIGASPAIRRGARYRAAPDHSISALLRWTRSVSWGASTDWHRVRRDAAEARRHAEGYLRSRTCANWSPLAKPEGCFRLRGAIDDRLWQARARSGIARDCEALGFVGTAVAIQKNARTPTAKFRPGKTTMSFKNEVCTRAVSSVRLRACANNSQPTSAASKCHVTLKSTSV